MKHVLIAASLLIAVGSAHADWECTSSSNGMRRIYSEPYDDGDCKRVGPSHTGQPEQPRKPFKSNPKEAQKAMREGKAAVLENLKDPDSAKFRNLKTSRDLFLCGEVNAKNSMGGYVGFKRFYTMGAAGLTYFDDGSRTFLEDYAVSCTNLTRAQVEATRY